MRWRLKLPSLLLAGLCCSCGLGREAEPNDLQKDANRIHLGDAITAKVDDYRDRDYFQISVPAGTSKLRIRFDATRTLGGKEPTWQSAVQFQISLESARKAIFGVSEAKVVETTLTTAGGLNEFMEIWAVGLNPIDSEYEFTVTAE